MEATAYYSSTSGTYFPDEASLKEHYQSDLHRYNLKRKVAGLPPVTKDWFDARKAQLTLSGGVAEVQKAYYDPLTRKTFRSKNTYLAAINSKRYKDALRKSGQPAPEPVVSLGNQPPPPVTGKENQRKTPQSMEAGSVQARPSPLSLANSGRPSQSNRDHRQGGASSESDAEGSEASCWESASEDDITDMTDIPDTNVTSDDRRTATDDAVRDERGDSSTWEEWDVRRSLFDNRSSSSMEENLDYMFKNFGFYLPDAEYLSDPEGLLKYLGAKLQYGHTPIGTRGDDTTSRQFRSLEAVQRHMIDRNVCRLAYEDNEDEYADYYDYAALDAKLAEEDRQLALQDGSGAGGGARLQSQGMELSLPSSNGGSGPRRLLGNRSFAVYYRQRHPVAETRQSIAVNAVLARYRALNIALQTPTVAAPVKHAQRARRRYDNAEQAAVIKDTLNATRRQVQGPAAKQR